MSTPSHYRRSLCLLAAVVLAIGCRKAEQIQSYTVPKDPPRVTAGEVASATGNIPASPTTPADANAITDRMIAAILPDGERAWFFKAAGPIAAMDKHADQILEFLATIRPAGEQPLPTWKLPTGWAQRPGSAMRAATIVIPADKPLELTVTTLNWPGTSEAMLSNVNRWRAQMQLPPIGPQQLAETTSELKGGDATMTVVDLRGRFQSGGMMTPPFAAGGEVASPGLSLPKPATGSPPPSPSATPTDLPAGHPPVGSGEAPVSAPSTDLTAAIAPKFEVPNTWQVLPAEGMRKAAFSVADGPKQALVTVIEFSAGAGPMITDPLENVNRWRREVGLARVEKDSLATVTEQIKVGGQDATYMAAIPDASKPEESQIPRATLAAMVPYGGRIWFIKMHGARDLVAAEQQHFRDFLKSVRFAADRGATDGN